jgi:Na+-transporting NADH:ubiquinone oxidoreductase subunit C
MQKTKVSYIIGFCLAICLVCAVLVSLSAVGLKPMQDLNKQLDRQKKVLSVAGLFDSDSDQSAEAIQALYNQRIKTIVVDLKSGEIDREATLDVANFDQQKAKKDPATSKSVPKNLAGIPRIPNQATVFLVSKNEIAEDGSGFDLSSYIFPVEGKGLWSTLLGFVALDTDLNSIQGLTFYQHGETPGLGGEVDNPSWKAKWPGRKVFDAEGKIKIKVKKGMAGKPEEDPYQVDGLAGATITSNGVSHLLSFWLGESGFGPYIKAGGPAK